MASRGLVYLRNGKKQSWLLTVSSRVLYFQLCRQDGQNLEEHCKAVSFKKPKGTFSLSALVGCDEAADLLPKQGLALTSAMKHEGKR